MTKSNAADSKAQYVRKLKQWRLEKNSTKDKWEFAASQVQKRRLEGKETEIIINGRLVPAKRLKKEMARYVGCGSSSENVSGKWHPTSLPLSYMGLELTAFKALLADGSHAVTVRTPPADVFGSVQYAQIPWFQFQDLLDSRKYPHQSLVILRQTSLTNQRKPLSGQELPPRMEPVISLWRVA